MEGNTEKKKRKREKSEIQLRQTKKYKHNGVNPALEYIGSTSVNADKGGSLQLDVLTWGKLHETVQHSLDVSPAGRRRVVQQLTERWEERGGEEGLSEDAQETAVTWLIHPFTHSRLSV